MSLAYLFNTPSSFEAEPWKFARNAVGHAVIVGALPVFFFPVALPAALTLYAVWEYLQWRLRKAQLWDCFHDWAYVAGGALAVFEPLTLIPLVAFFVADILRRNDRLRTQSIAR